MNIFKKIYCRTFQMVFKLALPFLPYREPKILTKSKQVCETIIAYGKQNAMLVTDVGIKGLGLTKELEEELKLHNIKFCVFDAVVPNPTTANVESALESYKQNGCDCIIAFGGGSVMDCAKAMGARVVYPNKSLAKMKGVMRVKRKLPLFIAIPTTAGTGSETTLAAVITNSETRHKYAINSFPLIPHYALLDASLTLGLPKGLTATTGMDALTHAIEAYIGNSTTRLTRKCALDSVKLIFENLETAYQNGQNFEARKNMLFASYKAGVAFTRSYVGYVHAVAHSLGGKYNTPHGLANAVILPIILKMYGKKIYKKLWQMGVYAGLFNKFVSKEQGAKMLIQKIEGMNNNMNIPSYIEGLKQEDITELSKTAEHEANPLYPVPVLWTVKELEKIYYMLMRK